METALRKAVYLTSRNEQRVLDRYVDAMNKMCVEVAIFVGSRFDDADFPKPDVEIYRTDEDEDPWAFFLWRTDKQRVELAIQQADSGLHLRPVLTRSVFQNGKELFHHEWETKTYSAEEGATICNVVREQVLLAFAEFGNKKKRAKTTAA